MARPTKPDIEAILRDRTAIDHAVREGAREAVRMHQRLGNPIAVMRDGQAVDVPADEVKLPDDELQSPPNRRAAS